eukprot:gene7275-6856_t
MAEPRAQPPKAPPNSSSHRPFANCVATPPSAKRPTRTGRSLATYDIHGVQAAEKAATAGAPLFPRLADAPTSADSWHDWDESEAQSSASGSVPEPRQDSADAMPQVTPASPTALPRRSPSPPSVQGTPSRGGSDVGESPPCPRVEVVSTTTLPVGSPDLRPATPGTPPAKAGVVA